MTENSKIFLIKNAIMNIFAQQQLSIGLSLYIIKDIQQQFQKMYQQILTKELKEQQEEEEEKINNLNDTQQHIDMRDTGLTITSVENDNQDQAD